MIFQQQVLNLTSGVELNRNAAFEQSSAALQGDPELPWPDLDRLVMAPATQMTRR
jgi:hypothetical protein